MTLYTCNAIAELFQMLHADGVQTILHLERQNGVWVATVPNEAK